MNNKKTKILLFDIETSPNLGFIWGKYEQNVIEYEREWYMLCFAYKWLGQKVTKVCALPDYSSYKKNMEDDKNLIKELWELFDEADIIIAHNGDSFDIKMANARFAFHGLPPPSPYRTIDTKKVAKNHFRFNSNKLDDLGNYFGLGRKINTGGFELWKGCMMGDEKSWSLMKKYNVQDVFLLEDIYYKLLPWIVNHPNLNLTEDTICHCPNCGSNKIQRRGYGINKTTKYERLHCQDCGAWSKGSNIKNIIKK